MTDHDEPTLREQYAREKQELERDMAERARRAEAERVLSQARTNVCPDPVVTKSYPAPARRTVAPAPADMTAGWTSYIQRELDKRERAMMRAVAQVVVDEERQREALGERVKALEAEIANLRAELRDHQEPGQRSLRAVPASSPSALVA